MLQRLRTLAERREDFAFETTLAARTYAPWLSELRKSGYRLHIFYFWWQLPELNIERVAMRVRAGGHDIPERTIRQRYARSNKNLFQPFLPLASTWRVYDNSRECDPPCIASGSEDQQALIHDAIAWGQLRRRMDCA
jgi:predicted ABC-type ATPase